MALSFWLRMRIVDNTNYNSCYSFCWVIVAERQECFCFSCCLASGEWGVHKKLGEVRTRASDPHWPKGCCMPYGVTVSNKNWGKGERERHNQRNSVCLPTWPFTVTSSAFLKCLLSWSTTFLAEHLFAF